MSGTENNASAPKRSRKRWWFTWALVGVFGGVAVNLFAPRIYQASTNILIIPQRVPLTFVQPNVTAALSERLDMMSQIILSRTELERIIQEFHLYESERRVMIMEDLVAKMRRDISLTIPRPRTGDDQELRSFSVAFRHNAARTAMRVTERLASLFVRENLEDRQLLADQTDQFLKAEIEDLRGRLLGSDLKLRAARQRGLTLSDLTAEHDVLVATFK